MLDDFRDFIDLLGKMFLRRNSEKQEATQKYWDVDLRIRSRKTAFHIFWMSLTFLPMMIFLILQEYPTLKNDWNWLYWGALILINFGMYRFVVTRMPKIRKARTVYILRAVNWFPIFLFCIGFGQMVSFLLIPEELFIWTLLFYLPVLIYSPILFRKKREYIKMVIQSRGIRWKIKKEPVWYYREYLPKNGEKGPGVWGGLFYSLFVMTTFYFLVNIHRFFDYETGNIIWLGVINAVLLHFFIASIYQTILIALMFTELEQEIFQPILLEEL